MSRRYSNQSVQERSSRMAVAIEAAFEAELGHRPDLFVSDVLSLDKDSAFVAISHSEACPTPTAEDVAAYVQSEFEDKLTPVMTTAKYNPDTCTVVVLVASNAETRPIEAVANMHTVLAGHRYLDTQMKDTWEVISSPDGQKYLRRVADDDVVSMLKDRRDRIASAGKFASIASMLSSGSAKVGDMVRVYHRGEMYPDCTVKAANGDKLTVQIPNVGSTQVCKYAVVMQALGGVHSAEIKKETSDYYKKAYPDAKYAKELTKELINDRKGIDPAAKFMQPRTKK